MSFPRMLRLLRDIIGFHTSYTVQHIRDRDPRKGITKLTSPHEDPGPIVNPALRYRCSSATPSTNSALMVLWLGRSGRSFYK